MRQKTLTPAFWRRGTGDITIKLTPQGKKVFGNLNRPLLIRYANGTLIKQIARKGFDKIKVLARFASGLAQNGAPDIMPGREAIVWANYGRGKVMIFSPHPEYFSGKEFLLLKAIRFLAK